MTHALVVAARSSSGSRPGRRPVLPRRTGAAGRRAGRSIVTNPLSSQHSVLRQSLLGSLLEVVSTNLRQDRADVAIFEIGKGYGATGEDDADARVVAPRPRPDRGGRDRRPGTARARPYDLDDAQGR